MNKLRGTRSIGCKGKAGKEGGSKQGQTKKPKAEAEEDVELLLTLVKKSGQP